MAKASDIYGRDGMYHCICDHCGDTQHFDTFKEAMKYDCGCMSDKIATEIKVNDNAMISYKGGPPFYTEEYYRGNNYKQQDGCHNCKHHYCQEEYDEPDRIYCTLHGDPMPLDNSVLASVERDYTTTPEPDLLVMTEA